MGNGKNETLKLICEDFPAERFEAIKRAALERGIRPTMAAVLHWALFDFARRIEQDQRIQTPV